MPRLATSLDDLPINRFHRRIILLGAGGPFCDGYILGIIAVALTLITPDLKLDSVWVGLIGAASIGGMFIGGLVFGYLTDIVGRRTMYTLDLTVFVVLSVLQLFVTNVAELFAARLIMGIAIGADYPIATSMVAEFVPRKQRGPSLALLDVSFFVGNFTSYAVGYAMVGTGAWRWMLATSAVPALILVILRTGIPESPRWLMNKGRAGEARAVLDRHLGPGVTVAEDHVPMKPAWRQFGELFRGGYASRTVFVSVFWICIVAPAFAIHTFQPTLLKLLHVSDPVLSTLVIMALSVVGCGVGFAVVNRLGRRKLLLYSFVVTGVALYLLSGLGALSMLGAITIVLLFCIYNLAESAGSILEFIYPNELFPTHLRGTAVGFATAMSRIGGAAGTFLLPIMYAHIGVNMSLAIAALFLIVGTIVTTLLAPETSAKTLSEASTVQPVTPAAADTSGASPGRVLGRPAS